MSKDFKKALLGIAAALAAWGLQSWIAAEFATERRLEALEIQMKQVYGEQRYYHGPPVRKEEP
jgi:hypothetical protein